MASCNGRGGETKERVLLLKKENVRGWGLERGGRGVTEYLLFNDGLTGKKRGKQRPGVVVGSGKGEDSTNGKNSHG